MHSVDPSLTRPNPGSKTQVTSDHGTQLFPPSTSRSSSLPAHYQHLGPHFENRQYLVAGELRSWNGPLHDVRSGIATTGVGPEIIGRAPLMDVQESLNALQAAVAAYGDGLGAWPSLSMTDRISAVARFTSMMEERSAEIVALLAIEIGKSVPDAEREFQRTVEYIRSTLDAAAQLDAQASTVHVADGVAYTVGREPRGVTLCMGPFNYPLNETLTTVIPALLMGNTVVLKPAKQGILCLSPLLECFAKAFPPGAVNTVYGEGRDIIPPLMKSGAIDTLAFIGSSQVARILVGLHPEPERLHRVLGLGAKNPAIVLPDANLDSAVRECVRGALGFNGQRCTALKAIFVHQSIAEEFVRKLSEQVSNLPMGLPWEDKVFITPLCEPGKAAQMQTLIEDATARGARICNSGGGKVVDGLFRPAVLYPVRPGMRLFQEEQFGPLVQVSVFSDVGEVLQEIKRLPFGQQASIFGTDVEALAHLVRPLLKLTARVNINTQCQRGPDEVPFAGRKQSAVGVLSVMDALLEFSVPAVRAAADEKALRSVYE